MSTRRPAITPTVIIEDDPVLRRAVRGALEDAGFHPIECADLATARAALERTRPVVIVLDLALGDEFGTELLEELAKQDDAPAVVVCSAFPLANMVAARFSIPYLRKPFELDTFVAEVDRAIQERRVPRVRQTA